MATWSEVYTLSGFVQNSAGVATDGDFIYYWDSTEGLYRYDPSNNVDLLIADNTELDYIDSNYSDWVSLQNFNGNVYVGVKHDTGGGAPNNHVVIWRISGSTIVEVTQVDTAVGASKGRLFSDGNILVIIAMNIFGDSFSAYSANASTWSTVGTVWNVGTPDDIQNISGVYGAFGHDNRALGMFCAFEDSGSNYVYKFVSNQWIRQPDPLPSGSLMFETGPTYHITRHDGQEYTTDFDTYTIPSFIDVFAACQLNMPFSMGHWDNGGDTEIYKFEAGAWTLLDTAPGIQHQNPTGGSLPHKMWLIRLDSGSAYAFTRVSTTWSVWERSEAFDPPDEPMGGGGDGPCINYAIFYYGIETPTVRGELPFCGVNPGALAVSASGIVIVGGNPVNPTDSFSSSVVYADFPYDDTDFEDMSGIVPLDTGVSSIKIV